MIISSSEAYTSLSSADNHLDEELYLMLLFLCAKVRLYLTTQWSPSLKQYQELGEEEAAILTSAQSVLADPSMCLI